MRSTRHKIERIIGSSGARSGCYGLWLCLVGAESSSGADSSEWEKEFDIDMTEDEIKQALQEENNEVGV